MHIHVNVCVYMYIHWYYNYYTYTCYSTVLYSVDVSSSLYCLYKWPPYISFCCNSVCAYQIWYSLSSFLDTLVPTSPQCLANWLVSSLLRSELPVPTGTWTCSTLSCHTCILLYIEVQLNQIPYPSYIPYRWVSQLECCHSPIAFHHDIIIIILLFIISTLLACY